MTVFGGLNVVSVSDSVWWFACYFLLVTVFGCLHVHSVGDSVWWFACSFC